jgi:hypothetical protein
LVLYEHILLGEACPVRVMNPSEFGTAHVPQVRVRVSSFRGSEETYLYSYPQTRSFRVHLQITSCHTVWTPNMSGLGVAENGVIELVVAAANVWVNGTH